MLAKAGQTAGLNWLRFFEGTHGCPAFCFHVFFIPRETPGTQLVYIIKLFTHIYLYAYLAIAGQNWLS